MCSKSKSGVLFSKNLSSAKKQSILNILKINPIWFQRNASCIRGIVADPSTALLKIDKAVLEIKNSVLSNVSLSKFMKNDKKFLERKATLMKKAKQLSKLCQSQICVVCYDSTSKLFVWPEDSIRAHSVISNYYEKLESKKRKNSEVGLSNVLGKKLRKLEEKVSTTTHDNGVSSLPFENWDEKLVLLSKNSLMGLVQYFEAKIKGLDVKIEMVSQTQVQNNNDDQDHDGFDQDDYFHSLPPLMPLPPPLLLSMPQHYGLLKYEDYPIKTWSTCLTHKLHYPASASGYYARDHHLQSMSTVSSPLQYCNNFHYQQL
ncbi:hypothetical protein F8388_021728 [Cannabis sativa]|uniref:MADS-box domain-containing protein n=1 Tax=Cannabis sativa TaxID=3483 RepID=A0A7J6E7H9_CANSA|nr:hypothetical protein F8388_021728 [Cannabis sativa]